MLVRAACRRRVPREEVLPPRERKAKVKGGKGRCVDKGCSCWTDRTQTPPLAPACDQGAGRLAAARRVSTRSPSALGPASGSGPGRERPRSSPGGTAPGGTEEANPQGRREEPNHQVTISSFPFQNLRLGLLSRTFFRRSGGVCVGREGVGGPDWPSAA